ncbi:DEAD/DEAH box helicase [Pseudomonas mosselii]|uniref:DEAD/DEAH box helicase n=1 Tax=Pseudomonas mosselii TaxID=78327 RepID=UPI0021D8EDD1|nr:ATP-binding domain-containing protein [Pseudomonas mosselii]MCU9531791.1 ATP-binding domain-containing protein [Pseudomonas mosselii]MCU9538304.1 ATP-binding domain-containing protein [Pseudomonas mosselii]MCU9541416.1 ATP-binding domain-containing protein [Pseudomonas mosselii]MCU9550682.1 ATP-binding domain-containing protein [Pseudomonas mosselii]
MEIEILVTSDRIGSDHLARDFISFLKTNYGELNLDGAVLYYDFPSYSDYETVTHKPDALLLSPQHGIIAFRFVSSSQAERLPVSQIHEISESLNQFCSILIGRLLKSKTLRKSRSALAIEIVPVIYCDSDTADRIFEGDECEVVNTNGALKNLLGELENESTLSLEQIYETRSVIEGAKALTRSGSRVIENPATHKEAVALSNLEAEIANFDQKQRRAALITINGPQRIRGLAGSGKTVILAMKAAHLHMTKPTETILVTFFTKSLRSPIKNLITKFFRHYTEVDPDWSKINILHGWGGSNTNGTYSDASRRAGRIPMSFGAARGAAPIGVDPFQYACADLVATNSVQPYYDHILIDEGQDFPAAFYQLCFQLAKGTRDKKNIVWAYDELQNILNVKMPSSEELFGLDDNNEPCISLDRAAAGLPPGAVNDTVLSKCYRNQREVLTTAHAMGFGIYSEIIQLLESPDHWRDVGYHVQAETFETGASIEIMRPAENSPVSLEGDDLPQLIKHYSAPNVDHEIDWVTQDAKSFLDGGLLPEDIIVIALDDRNARHYFKRLSASFASAGIATNNIHADPYSEPPFSLQDKITLSTVYRAKGNEAAVVYVVGVDAMRLRQRSDRNKLFVAFTRTKAWLRVSGCQGATIQIGEEIDAAAGDFPFLRFRMPDLSQMNLIQRDTTERTLRAKQLREEFITKFRAEGFSDDEIEGILSGQEAKDD